MIARSLSTNSATLTFTSDFHELLRGYLDRGRDVRIRYDPLRIVPPGDDYVFGDPARPIVGHARFGKPNVTSVTLNSVVGVQPDRQPDITGEGSMLTATVDIPPDAAELELWFSFEAAGSTVYDSDFGTNFHFGFARDQIAVIRADVSKEGKTATFVLEVSAASDVHRVVARVHAAKIGAFPSFNADLEPAGDVAEGWRTWTLKNVTIALDEIVRFKLYYWLGAWRYKEDNDGLYYLAPIPPQKKVASPPSELAAAAKQWI